MAYPRGDAVAAGKVEHADGRGLRGVLAGEEVGRKVVHNTGELRHDGLGPFRLEDGGGFFALLGVSAAVIFRGEGRGMLTPSSPCCGRRACGWLGAPCWLAVDVSCLLDDGCRLI